MRKTPVKLDRSQNYLPFLYTAPIYKNTYTEYPSDIETDYTKKIVDIKNFTINKFFEQQTPYRAESSPQSSRLIFSPLDIIVGFTDKQFSIVNK